MRTEFTGHLPTLSIHKPPITIETGMNLRWVWHDVRLWGPFLQAVFIFAQYVWLISKHGLF
ncbi:MAG: hypothetical protein DMG39_30750 [Acidobacteria bacterium]|nr:MAG: hypothetical protein DMG39_30750 [Acidobacteriota bacterium]